MEMTFQQYIANPMGVKNSVFSGMEMYRAKYAEKLNAIYVREKGEIQFRLYKDKKNYYVYFKIPSEVVEDFYYDVVIMMYPKDMATSLKSNLKDYYVKFYSNDPSFVYTFAHSFEKNKLFIDDLAPKMSKTALKNRATERNPKDEVGYVKSIFFAYLVMEQQNLFSKSRYSLAENYDKKQILNMIMDADEKIQLRQEGATKTRKKKHSEPKPDTKSADNKTKKPFNDDKFKPIFTPMSKKSNVVGRSKTSKVTKKVKRI